MRRGSARWWWLLAWVLMAAPVAADGVPAVTDLGWMAGCWAGDQDGARIEETWTAPAGGTMLGVARVLAREKTVFTEFIQIRQTEKGPVMSVALGIGRPAVSFTAVASKAGEAVFENPQHDFPQRIIYRKGEGTLFARIEGTEKGQPKAEDFNYKKVSCP